MANNAGSASWNHIFRHVIEEVLLWGYNCGIAFPPLQKLRMCEPAAIPEGAISKIDHFTVPAGHDKKMTSIITIRGKADDNGIALICTRNNLVERPCIAPGRLKAEPRGSICNSLGSQHSLGGRNFSYSRFHLQNVSDTIMIAI